MPSSTPHRRYTWTLLATLCLVAGLPGEATSRDSDPLLEEALEYSKKFDPATDLGACRKAFEQLASGIEAELESARKQRAEPLPAKQVIATLNRRILLQRKVSYLSNQYWRDSLFTAALIKKTGNCVSTSLLYYLIGRRLDLPVRLAVAPEHMFVRYEDGGDGLNIETTAAGRVVGRAELLRRFELEERDAAECGFLRSLTVAEASAELYDVWATTLAQLDDDDGALALIDRALALTPGSRRLRLSKAGQLLSMGRASSAKIEAQKAVLQSESHFLQVRGAMLYCRILEEARDFDGAIAVARYGMRFARKRQIGHLCDQLGRLYRHKRDFERAIAYHQMTADIRYDADAFNSLGSALTEAHRDREAIAAYETAVQLNPEDYFPKVILAGLYERTGDRQRGRTLFASIAKPRGNTLGWLNALVWYYAVIGEEEKLLESMRTALDMDKSTGTWNYYQREPDLDPYRKKAAFVELMKRFRPR